MADSPVGQSFILSPVGPDVIVDQIQPVAGQYITHGPVGSDGMLSTCDSDRPVADGPVGQSFILGPVGPRRMFSQCKPNQWLLAESVAVGPVGQSFTTGPVGPCEMVSNCKRMDRIAYSPVGSTVIPDPVEQTESHIQTDFMEIVTTDGPSSLGDTPPSSDSGIQFRRTVRKYEYQYDGYRRRTERKADNWYPNGAAC